VDILSKYLEALDLGRCPVLATHALHTDRLAAGAGTEERAARRYSVLLCGTLDLQTIPCQQVKSETSNLTGRGVNPSAAP
jgi:hypothetical protein